MRKLRRMPVRAITRLRSETDDRYSLHTRSRRPLLGTSVVFTTVVCAAASLAQAAPGIAFSPPGKLLARYSTPYSDTYQLPDGRLLTRVFAHATARTSRPRAASRAKVSPFAKRPGEPSLACTVNSAKPETSACNEASFQIGVEALESYRRALLLFSLPNLGPVTVEKARLGLYETSSTSPTTYTPITAYPIVTEWNGSVTWKSPWPTKPGGEYTTKSYAANGEVETGQAESLGKTTGWHYWYPTRMVQQWINGAAAPRGEGLANDGMLLMQNGESTENVITFAGVEQEEKGPVLEYTTVVRGAGNAPNYTLLPVSSSKSTTAKVNVASGDLLLESTDLSVPSRGWPAFEASRASNGLEPNAQPGFGAGWIATDAPYVEAGPDGVKGRNGSQIYHDGTGNTFVFINNVNGETNPPPGIEAVMCVNEEGGAAICPSKKAGEPLPHKAAFDLYYKNTGEQIFFANKEGRNYPLAVALHGEEELVEKYSSVDQEPTVWKDSAGEKLTYTVSSTAGIGYTKISGPGSRKVTYTEKKVSEAVGYKLSEAKNESGEATKYAYSTSSGELGLLTTLTEPNGNTIKVAYDSARQVKSVELIAAGQNNGPVTTYTYYEAGHAPTPCTAAQHAVAVTMTSPERGALYCSNTLDEVEKVHELKPPVFAPFEVAAYDESASGSTLLYFSGAEDPPLPDGSPGPEVATYTYRYSVNGGPFSAWAELDPIEVEVPHIAPGATVTIEVYATDTEGNVSSVVTASTVVPEIGLGIEVEEPGETGEVELTEQSEAKSEEEEDPGPFKETPCPGSGPCGQYKWWTAKAYAERWAHSHNEEYSYFEEVGADCANFVSQALHAGGLRFMRTSGHNSPNVTDGGLEGFGFHTGPGAWWSAYTEDLETFPPTRVQLPTIAWDNAGRLYEHLLNFGLARVLKSHVAEPPRPGDLVFYDEKGTALTGSTIGHVQIVVKTEKGMTFVQQHTKPYPQPHTLGYIIRKVNAEKGPLGEKWAYVIMRPIHTAANLYK